MVQTDVVEKAITSQTKAIVSVHYAEALYDLNAFHVIKNITCVEGDLVATDDNALATRLIAEPRFKHNISDIHAAIAVVQLIKLTQINKRRVEFVAYYRQALANLPLKMLDVPSDPHLHANYLFMVRVDKAVSGIERDSFMERLK